MLWLPIDTNLVVLDSNLALNIYQSRLELPQLLDVYVDDLHKVIPLLSSAQSLQLDLQLLTLEHKIHKQSSNTT